MCVISFSFMAILDRRANMLLDWCVSIVSWGRGGWRKYPPMKRLLSRTRFIHILPDSGDRSDIGRRGGDALVKQVVAEGGPVEVEVVGTAGYSRTVFYIRSDVKMAQT